MSAFTASDFHPDLRKIARLTPKQSVTPVTLPIMRFVSRRMWRRAPEDVEALTLPSGVGVWLYRPPAGAGSNESSIKMSKEVEILN